MKLNSMMYDDMVEHFDNTLSELLDLHAPIISKNIKVKDSCSWYNGNLNNLKKNKKRIEHKWLESNIIDHFKEYKIALNLYNRKCNESKVLYYSNIFKNCNNDQKTL